MPVSMHHFGLHFQPDIHSWAWFCFSSSLCTQSTQPFLYLENFYVRIKRWTIQHMLLSITPPSKTKTNQIHSCIHQQLVPKFIFAINSDWISIVGGLWDPLRSRYSFIRLSGVFHTQKLPGSQKLLVPSLVFKEQLEHDHKAVQCVSGVLAIKPKTSFKKQHKTHKALSVHANCSVLNCVIPANRYLVIRVRIVLISNSPAVTHLWQSTESWCGGPITNADVFVPCC